MGYRFRKMDLGKLTLGHELRYTRSPEQTWRDFLSIARTWRARTLNSLSRNPDPVDSLTSLTLN